MNFSFELDDPNPRQAGELINAIQTIIRVAYDANGYSINAKPAEDIPGGKVIRLSVEARSDSGKAGIVRPTEDVIRQMISEQGLTLYQGEPSEA